MMIPSWDPTTTLKRSLGQNFCFLYLFIPYDVPYISFTVYLLLATCLPIISCFFFYLAAYPCLPTYFFCARKAADRFCFYFRFTIIHTSMALRSIYLYVVFLVFNIDIYCAISSHNTNVLTYVITALPVKFYCIGRGDCLRQTHVFKQQMCAMEAQL